MLLTAFIFIRSSKSAAVSSGESRRIIIVLEGIVKFFLDSPPDNLQKMLTVIVRKTAHIVEFTALSCTACRIVKVYGKPLKQFFVWVLFTGLLTACVDEAIQLISDGRAGMIADVFIDFSGTLLGVCISAFVIHIHSECRKKA